MKSLIVYGKYVVADADTVIPSGAVYIENDSIIEVGTYADITKTYKANVTYGSTDHLRPVDCFRMGTAHGAAVLGFSDRIGTLTPNKKPTSFFWICAR